MTYCKVVTGEDNDRTRNRASRMTTEARPSHGSQSSIHREGWPHLIGLLPTCIAYDTLCSSKAALYAVNRNTVTADDVWPIFQLTTAIVCGWEMI